MDFGFASLLDKFEEHYGKRAGKALVGLVGVAVTSFCFGLIWSFIAPIMGWVTDTAAGQSVWWWFWKFAGFGIAIWLVVTLGTSLSSFLEARNLLRMSKETLSDSIDVLDDALNLLRKTRKVMAAIESASSGGDGSGTALLDERIEEAEKTKKRMQEVSKKLDFIR